MNAYEEVLYNCCSEETIGTYINLNEEAKSKMLEAIKDYILTQNTVQAFHQIDNFPLEEESWLHEKEITYICKAINSGGSTVFLKYFRGLLNKLREWGAIKSRSSMLLNHYFSIDAAKKEPPGPDNLLLTTSSDVITKIDGTFTNFSKLQQIFIQDLKLFSTAKGQYLEGRLISDPYPYIGIITYLEDDNGDYVMLDLYNMISLGTNKWELAEQKFPKDIKLKISEPFYKIFQDGNRGIRVDSPNEILIEENNKINFTLIRAQGKELFKQGEFLSALKLYTDGLGQLEDTAGIILNNRAQAELKLEENEEALLDSAAALMFGDNEKARCRYNVAIEKCGLIVSDVASIQLTWEKALTKLKNFGLCNLKSTKDEANALYREGKYEEAKLHYTAALCFPEACLLLNNIATVCMKLKILQTAIASASACLRIATDQRAIAKARFSMTKSFWILGNFPLAKLSAKDDSSLKHFWENVAGPELQAKLILEERAFRQMTCGQTLDDDYLNTETEKEIPGDFVNTDMLQYAYIKHKGRGMRAISDITAGELLVLDHPVALSSTGADAKGDDEFSLAAVLNFSNDSSTLKSECELANRILHLINFDGLLTKKLILLKTRRKAIHDEKLPLVDLKWMAHQNLSYEVLPFLPQHPRIVGCDTDKVSPTLVRDLIKVNTIEWGGTHKHELTKEKALFLLLSLFNHNDESNCRYARIGDSIAVHSKRNIKKNEELTI